MFLKKLSIKKIFYGILFSISSFSYIGWLSFDLEKKKDLLDLSLNFSDSNIVKVLPIYSNNVNSVRIDEFKAQYEDLFSLIDNSSDLASIIFDLELYAHNLNSYTILELLEKENTTNYILSFIIHYVLSSLFLIIGLLIAVAYFTLLERKAMASMQRRKGPNVVGFWGLLQPLADGLKLLAKEIVIPRRASIKVFIGSPLYTFLMSLMGWCVIP